MSQVFISHASTDAEIAQEIVTLLSNGVGVPTDQIFCTSAPGSGIAAGDPNSNERMRRELNDATCVMFLVTEDFKRREFPLGEAGGTWVLGKTAVPIIVPPLDFSGVPAVLKNHQAIKIHDPAGLDAMYDWLSRTLPIRSNSAARWNKAKERFMERLPEYVPNLMNENIVQHFEVLVSGAAGALGGLPPVVHEVIRCEFVEGDCGPENDDEWEDAEVAEEDGYLELDYDDRTMFLNEDNDVVRTALNAANELADWLEKAPNAFLDWHKNEYGCKADISKEKFWKTHF